MGHRFAELAFTDGVKAIQDQRRSRACLCQAARAARRTTTGLSPAEAAFIAARDSFYMATVTETGWPYVQHRGGPPGFLRVLDERTIGFADFRGNRQYVSVGNLASDDRVSLILVDYPHQRPPEDPGSGAAVAAAEDTATLRAAGACPGYRARVERGPPDRRRGVRLELPAAHHAALHRSGDRGRGGAAACAHRRAGGGAGGR